MTREEALRSAVRAVADEPFAYGSHDCCQFVRRVATAVTGHDPAPCMEYASAREACEIIRSHGGLEGLLCSVFGAPSPIDALQTADPCLVRLPTIGVLAVVLTCGGALVPMPRGLIRAPSSSVLRGWSL